MSTIREITSQDFNATVSASDRPVLVDFYGTYCNPCVRLLPVLEEIAAQQQGVEIVKFNAHNDPEFAARYRVSSVPNLVLFKNGEPIGQRIGLTAKSDLLNWLASETTK
jgi:thioredoxin